MAMDYIQLSRFGSYISKEYSKEIFNLLMKYSDISASEAASRLNLHIKTVQDFLEAMADSGILTKEKVRDKRRPFYRYALKETKINIELDLKDIADQQGQEKDTSSYKIREKTNSGARFNTARYDSYFNSVVIWHGIGRDRKERKYNLTVHQGKVLFNLPFPGAEPLSIESLMDLTNIERNHMPEILDIITLLIENNVIEKI
jgi:predicted transcriptional regulator